MWRAAFFRKSLSPFYLWRKKKRACSPLIFHTLLKIAIFQFFLKAIKQNSSGDLSKVHGLRAQFKQNCKHAISLSAKSPWFIFEIREYPQPRVTQNTQENPSDLRYNYSLIFLFSVHFDMPLCSCALYSRPERAAEKLLYSRGDMPFPAAYRNFSSLCTLNVVAAINCASNASQRHGKPCNSRAISPRRFGRRHTTVGSSSWIVLYLLWINSWRERERVCKRESAGKSKSHRFCLSRVILWLSFSLFFSFFLSSR